MAIAGYAIGAQKGYIYCRAEYPLAVKRLRTAIDQAREYGLLGTNIFGSDFSFDIELMEGAGAFVCGEETALMASIEGRRAEPRPRPPFPATSGLWGKPTNINNVKTYASIPQIILKGADWFASMGTEKSKGTAVFALAGDVNNTGLVEIPMGITLGEIILDIGGGIAKGRKFKAVQIGGPLGGCLPVELLNTPIDFESITATGAIMGSGGMIVADENTCMVELARFFLEFATNESCGKCVPCRAGGQLLLEILKRITEGKGVMKDLDMIEHISEVINKTALCNLGVLTPNPINTTVKYFKDEFLAHIIDKRCPAGVCEALVPAPCRSGCPAEVNVPIYVAHIANGEYDKALAVHRETNPFPSICGRVCPAFCEKKCRRGALDKPVAIRVLKRFMADKEIEQWKPTILEKEKEQRVAIVGGGPAGLTAALRLAQHGYKATIFEAESILGGMMAWGIPDYRLPKDVLKREIDSITSLDSIEVKLNTAVGKDISFDFLKKEYDAVLLAVGAPKSRKLGIPGEDGEGVVHGIDFLKGLNLGEDTSYVKGKRVSVIGGGDVAIDAARSLIRLGAVEVTIVYRRRREDMPAIKEEIKTAGREGVKFMFLVTPKEVANRNGKVVSLRCQKMKLEGENNRPLFDASGRKRPFPIEGAEIVLDVDMVVPAIGEGTDLSFIKESTSRIETDRGTIITDPRTFITSEKGVFAVGDVVSGPATIIDAVAQGNCVAKVIQRYLQGEEELMPPAEILKRSEGMGEFKITEGDASRPRQKQSCLTMEERKGNFREVELGFPNEKRAKAEARRCIRCDLESVE
jgi:NADH-quinone oxidoreductase subunit F